MYIPMNQRLGTLCRVQAGHLGTGAVKNILAHVGEWARIDLLGIRNVICGVVDRKIKGQGDGQGHNR